MLLRAELWELGEQHEIDNVDYAVACKDVGGSDVDRAVVSVDRKAAIPDRVDCAAGKHWNHLVPAVDYARRRATLADHVIQQDRRKNVRLERAADVSGVEARERKCRVRWRKNGQLGIRIRDCADQARTAQCCDERREVTAHYGNFSNGVVAGLEFLRMALAGRAQCDRYR